MPNISETTPASGLKVSILLDIRAHVQQILARDKGRKEREERPQVCALEPSQTSFAHTGLWLQRTEWLRIYRNARREILLAMTQVPTTKASPGHDRAGKVLGRGLREAELDVISPQADEEKIRCFLGAVEVMLDRCKVTAQHTSRVLLCWLLSLRPQTYQSRASPLVIEETTYKRYKALWYRLMAFILRAYRMRDEFGGGRMRRDARCTSDIMEQVHGLWDHEIWAAIDMSRARWPKFQSNLEYTPAENNGLWGRDLQGDREGDGEDKGDEDEDEDEDEEYEEDEESEEEEGEENIDEEDGEPEFGKDNEHEVRGEYGWIFKSLTEAPPYVYDDFLERLFRLNITLISQESPDGQPGSTILTYFSGILGLSSNGQGFRQAREYCTSLSGLLYIQG